jgi:hypothetical protein
MKKLAGVVCVILLGLCFIPDSEAFFRRRSCRSRCNAPIVVQRVKVVKEVAAVVAAVAVPVVQTIAVQVPTYSVTYAPQVYSPAINVAPPNISYSSQTTVQQAIAAAPAAIVPRALTCEERLTAIEIRIGLIAKRLEAMAGPEKLPPPQPANGQAWIGILNRSCYACHNAKDAPQKSNGFVIFSAPNQLAATLDAKAALSMSSKIIRNQMPKRPNREGPNGAEIGPLTDQEADAVFQGLSEQFGLAPKKK